ncbi:MAG: Multidrug resistance protein MdtG [Candidatus Omnitrophica bacterium]|nr:Multidrug resistance protein MdtG [Candidatus Omnitrophota bacterium]
MKLRGVAPNVWVFGCVSFLTDVSSDMIYPLLPAFLTVTLGAGAGFVGLVEGLAESTAAFFTLASGVWADRSKDRGRLVLLGYSLSSLSRPLVSLAQTPWVVLFIRFTDRVGKGIRTSPRDALIADSTDDRHRGRAYGLHRSMDHAGAVVGPLVATLLLATCVKDLRVLFACAAVPGLLAVALILWKVREVPAERRVLSVRRSVRPRLPSGRLRAYLLILLVFILSCSSDAFLLLRAADLGVPAYLLPAVWMLFNLVKAATTLPLGILSDRIGRRRVILYGWTVYIAVYVGFALADQAWQAWALFAAYGLFYGFTEGSERAVLADTAPPEERGEAFGWYYFVVGLGSLPASLLFGAVWQSAGAPAAFLLSAAISSVAAVAMAVFMRIAPSTRAATVLSAGPSLLGPERK